MNESKNVAYTVAFEALGLSLYVLPAYDVCFSHEVLACVPYLFGSKSLKWKISPLGYTVKKSFGWEIFCNPPAVSFCLDMRQ